ncbi:MAG: hypothetical protein K0R46_2211, partial [Herbinix sp.]|nr:hypothetical protein [Herbinix sp.]
MKTRKNLISLSVLLILVSLLIIFAKTQPMNNNGQTLASDMPPIIT